MYKNTYGNSPLKVAVGQKSMSWIKRIQEGGEPERYLLAEELKQSREEERSKAEQGEQEEKAK
jgi:hypothetical protein